MTEPTHTPRNSMDDLPDEVIPLLQRIVAQLHDLNRGLSDLATAADVSTIEAQLGEILEAMGGSALADEDDDSAAT